MYNGIRIRVRNLQKVCRFLSLEAENEHQGGYGMLRDKHGITKKEKNHPQASDGSSRHDHQFSSVPTSTVNIVARNVTKSNIAKQETLENYLQEAARLYNFPETMHVKVVLHHLIMKGAYTAKEIGEIDRFLSKIKARLGSGH